MAATKYLSLINIKYEDLLLLLRALDGLAGSVDDMATLSEIDALQKKIKNTIEDSKNSFRS